MIDPPSSVNCPRCEGRLSYRKTGAAWRRRLQKSASIETGDAVHLYHCTWHGFWGLWPDGRLGYVLNSLHWWHHNDFEQRRATIPQNSLKTRTR